MHLANKSEFKTSFGSLFRISFLEDINSLKSVFDRELWVRSFTLVCRNPESIVYTIYIHNLFNRKAYNYTIHSKELSKLDVCKRAPKIPSLNKPTYTNYI